MEERGKAKKEGGQGQPPTSFPCAHSRLPPGRCLLNACVKDLTLKCENCCLKKRAHHTIQLYQVFKDKLMYGILSLHR